MDSAPNPEVSQMVNAAQGSIPDVGLLMLAILTSFALIFSLLIYRRVGHMVHVLPTPLSPHLRTAAIGYIVYVAVTLLVIIAALL